MTTRAVDTHLHSRRRVRPRVPHARRFTAAERHGHSSTAWVTALLETITDAAFVVDARWVIRALNHEAGRLAGQPRARLVGEPFWGVLPGLLGTPVEGVLRDAAAKRRAVTGDELTVELGRPLVVRVAPVAIGLAITFAEPLAGEAAARLLQESEARFRATFEQAAVGLAHVALDGQWLRVNDRLCAIVGYSREELLTKTFQEITHPDDLALDLAHLERLLAGEISTYAIEKRYLRKDGSVVWVNVTVAVLRDEDGRPLHFITVVEDIDARKRTMLAYDESRTRLNLALDAAELGTWDVDLRTGEFLCSDRYRTIMGLPLGVPLVRSDVQDRMHPDDRQSVGAAIERAIATDSVYTAEYRVISIDGSVRWISTAGRPMVEHGEAVRIVGVALDITGRRDQEARQRFLVELYGRLSQPMGAEGLQAIVTREMLGFFGFSRTIFAVLDPATRQPVSVQDERAPVLREVAPFPFDELAVGPLSRDLGAGRTVVIRDLRDDTRTVPAADRFEAAGVAALIAVPLHTEGAWSATLIAADRVARTWRPDKVRLLRSAAEHLWLALENHRLYEEAVAALAERDATLTALGESEARFRRLSDANIFGVCFWHGDGSVFDANDAFLGLVGATRDDLIAGRLNSWTLTPPEWHAADRHAAQELQITGVCTPYEKTLYRTNETEIPVLVAAAVFPGRDEGVAIVFDLTERKEQERFEQEFLAGLAHDLKNPLAAMKAQAQLMRRRLRRDRLTPEIADEGLSAIELNVNRVARRIEELMDIALLRSGRALDLLREPADLVALTATQLDAYRQSSERHQIALEAPPEPLIGHWDVNRIERAIDDLLSNAIKYSPNGGEIAIRLAREEQDGRAWATLAVTDHGVGIPPGDLPHIFTRFRRGSNVQGRMRGTGIGLAGVRLLVEQHGGSIAVESREGEGSTFTLRLPLDE